MNFIPEEIEKYVLENSTKESEVLGRITRETYLNLQHPKMLSGHLQGKLLEFISRMINPNRILEIGTFTAYSTICLAQGLKENGILYTIEKNPELEIYIKKNIKHSNIEHKVKYFIGDAKEVITDIEDTFDLVFIDADKENYLNYFELVLPKTKKGGFIIADNVLWSGKVLNPAKNNDKETRGIVNFNNKIKNDERIENLILPFRDGLSIIRKK